MSLPANLSQPSITAHLSVSSSTELPASIISLSVLTCQLIPSINHHRRFCLPVFTCQSIPTIHHCPCFYLLLCLLHCQVLITHLRICLNLSIHSSIHHCSASPPVVLAAFPCNHLPLPCPLPPPRQLAGNTLR